MSQAELIERSGKSRNALAKAVLAEWTKQAPRDQKPKPRSLGTIIGNLARGDTDWWRKRPRPTRILATLLDCDPKALLADSARTTGAVTFSDFPSLAPLQADEQLARLLVNSSWSPLLNDVAESLTDAIRSALFSTTPTWIVAAPGTGKEVAVRHARLSRGSDVAVVEAETLLRASHAPALAGDIPAIVLVARRANTDVRASEELAQRRGATVVVAAFSPLNASKWSILAPRLHPQWRRKLVEWVLARVGPGGRLTVEDCLDEFDVTDPNGEFVVTPGDALPLLAWMHTADEHTADVPLVQIADALVDDRLARIGCSRPLVEKASEALRVAAATALDLQARGARPGTAAEWMGTLPVVSVPPARAAREAAIKALEEAPTKLRAKRRAELEALLETDGKPEVLEALIRARLLVEADCGIPPLGHEVSTKAAQLDTRFDIYPHLVRRAYERAAIDEAIATASWKRLGRWAASPAVRPIVLDALLLHERREVVRLAERVLLADARDLSWAALVEVLFEAVAERLTPELSDRPEVWRPVPEDEAVLVALGEVQASLVSTAARARGSKEPTRLTASPPNWSPENAAWLMRAWGYSLAVPAPSIVPEHAGWAFPGWLSAAPPDAWLPTVPSHRDVPDDVWRVFVRQLAVARRLVREHPATVRDNAPTIIQAAAIIEGIGAEHLRDPRRTSTDAVIAALVADEKDEVARSTIAARVWNSFERAPEHDPVLALDQVGVLREFLVDALPSEAFLDGMDVEQVVQTMSRGGQLVDALPDRLLEALFGRMAPVLVEQTKHSISLPHAVQRLTSLDTLVTLLNGRHSLPIEAAARLWTLDPGVALAELERRLPDRPESAACLILGSPAPHAEAVVGLVRVPPPSLARFLPRWLAERVGAGNADADLLFDTLIAQPEFALPTTTAPYKPTRKQMRRP